MNKNKQNTRNKSYQPKKETIFDFEPYLNKQITIYFNGGRQIMGIVKSYDILSNLVLDNVKEIVNKDYTRELGLIFVKGTNVRIIFNNLLYLDIFSNSWYISKDKKYIRNIILYH